MTGRKIKTFIPGLIIILMLLAMNSAGYAADIVAPVKGEKSAPSMDAEESGRKLFSAPEWADSLRLIPSLAITAGYNDNVYFATTDKKGDWFSLISPGLELIYRTERTEASLSARFNGSYYADQHENLNDIDQFYKGKLRHALTERLGLGVEAGFSRDSSAARDINTTGTIFPSNVIRDRQNYIVSGDWRITGRTTAGVSYNYLNDHYNQPAYTDMSSHSVGLNFITALNETTKGRLNFGYSNYYMGGTTLNNYSGTVGIDKSFNEIWSVLIDAGTVYTHTRYNILTQERTNGGWGPMGQVAIACKYEKTDGKLTLSRSVIPLSGYATTANNTSLVLDIRHRFTYELSGFLTAGYFINKSDPGEYANTGIDQNTITISIGPRYNFNKDISITPSYMYSRVDYKLTDTYADRHLVMLTLNLQYTFWE